MSDLLRDSAPLDEPQVCELEAILELRLPDDFRNFLKEHNAPLPAGHVSVQTPDGESLTDVKCFLGVHPSYERDLAKAFAAFDGRLPSMLIPIARDSGGNLICLDCRSGKGGVYFADSEFLVDGEPPQIEEMLKLADSFSDLLRQIR